MIVNPSKEIYLLIVSETNSRRVPPKNMYALVENPSAIQVVYVGIERPVRDPKL